MTPAPTPGNRVVVPILLWLCLLAGLPGVGLPTVARGDDTGPWAAVDAAHRRFDFTTERRLLEAFKDRNQDVQWLWRMARLDFDEAYQMEEGNARKRPLFREGLAFARKALAADDGCAEAHLYYAMIIGQLSTYEGNEAKIRVCREMKQHGLRAIALDPTSAYAHHMMGRWHYELADLSWIERTLAEALYGELPDASIEQAIQYFRTARKLEPGNVSHGLWLARSLLRAGRKEEARQVLEATVRLSPADAAGRKALAEARKLLNKLR